ncbi:RNB domain-containing ribonuclease [Enemella sp. A6]|uniref:RNB domain-containing ribonuclease n=1 Tax=Enemella sp. A6 TaxID=3440152 RepID=UPI003EBDC810
MPARHVSVEGKVPGPLEAGLEDVRADLGIDESFAPEVLAAAEAAARSPKLPPTDLREIEFVAIDPPGARDIDQAMAIEPHGNGWTLWYAIADVASFIEPGGVIDQEARRRGQTMYAPHRRYSLHPPVLSEGAASLLAGEDRPAQVWRLRLDDTGQVTEETVTRAIVRNRAQLTYEEVQRDLDAGTASTTLQALRDVGRLRQEQEAIRGGVSLPLPDQEVRVTESGKWRLGFRTPLPVEGWNAQISLVTGMAAATMMLYAEVGVLRTLPPAENADLRKLRQTARALSIPWPAEMDYPEFVRSLDPQDPEHAAMLYACTRLFRGAGYLPFNGAIPPTENAMHSALAAPYSHVTAPLRRLVDRYAGEVCLALSADQPVPEWVLSGLEDLPELMQESNRRANQFERRVVNLVEALVLSGRVGQTLEGSVVELDEESGKATIVARRPAVELSVRGNGMRLGSPVTVQVEQVDLKTGEVELSVVDADGETEQGADDTE